MKIEVHAFSTFCSLALGFFFFLPSLKLEDFYMLQSSPEALRKNLGSTH